MKRYNKFKIQYFAVFIFLALILFVKPDTVFAKAGGGTFDKKAVTNVEVIQDASSAEIIYTSTDLGFFRMGFRADLLESGSVGGSAESALSNFTSGIEGNKYSTSNNYAEVMKYPDIIMARQIYKNSNGQRTQYAVTGYMYLYVSSRDYEEYQKLFSSYKENGLPLYYSGKNQKGEFFFSIPGTFCYMSSSNIPVKGNGGMVYGQNYIETTGTSIQTFSKRNNAENLMKEICSSGVQNINDFSSVAGQKTIAVGSDYKALDGKYAWVLNTFNVAANAENTYDATGKSFLQSPSNERYEVSKDVLKDGFNYVKNLIGTTEFDAIIHGNTDLPYKDGLQPGYYRGYKANTQIIGVDKLVSDNSTALDLINSNRKFIQRNGDHLLNGEKLMQQAYNFIKGNGGGYNNVTSGGGHTNSAIVRYKLEQSQINSIYTAARAGTDTSFNAAIFNVNGMQMAQRYTFGCNGGALMGNTDCMFPRDVDAHASQSNSQNASDIVGRKIPASPKPSSYYMTKSFGHYASDNWGQFSEADKIQSTMVMIQYDPWYVPLYFKEKGARTINGLKFNGTATDIENLNKLGETNHTAWKKLIKEIGNMIMANSSTSSLPSQGVSSGSAYTANGFYCYESYGCSLVFSAESTYEDLLISNSYSTGIDTSQDGYGSLFNSPASRAYIDWTSEVTSGLNLSGLKKGGTTETNTVVGTKMKNLSGKQFDIYCGIRSISGAGQLAPDTDNIAAVGRSAGGKGTSNNSQIRIYSQNPAQHKFTTVFFVGRIPEADSEVEVKASDMVPTVFASFNKFDLVWDAGFDDNASGRATISINMSENKGTAQSALSSAIYAFSGDYNGKGTHLYKMNPVLVRNQLLKCSLRYSL